MARKSVLETPKIITGAFVNIYREKNTVNLEKEKKKSQIHLKVKGYLSYLSNMIGALVKWFYVLYLVYGL